VFENAEHCWTLYKKQKMKQILGFLLLAIIAISCNSNQTDLKESNIKGKVWKIQESSFEGEEKFGKYQIGDKNYSGHGLYVFNDFGNLLESHSLSRNGASKEVSKYLYNSNNICTEISTYSEDKLKNKQVNVIQGNKITEVKLFDENGELENFYRYEYSGNYIVSGKILDKKKKLTRIWQNKLNNGIVKSQTVKDSLENIEYVVKYNRNNNGDVIEQIISYVEDSTEYKYSFNYDYDKKNNWIKQYQFDKEGKIKDIIIRNIFYFSDSKEYKTEKDFIGMWFVVDDNDWIEFRKDKKYDLGYKDRIKESGNWEIDAKQHLLTFRANNPGDSRKYKYDFESYQMVLYTIQGDEKLRLEKR